MTTGVAIATSSSSRARDREVREASRRIDITMRSALGKRFMDVEVRRRIHESSSAKISPTALRNVVR
jgi:hypothetical protein